MKKYKFNKHLIVWKVSLLIVRKFEIVKIRNWPQKTLNIQKQMKFDSFTFREFFQFERVTMNLVTNTETITFEIKRIIQRANPISEKNQKKKRISNTKQKKKRDQKNNRNDQTSKDRNDQKMKK